MTLKRKFGFTGIQRISACIYIIGKLYRSLNQTIKFGVVINQGNVLDRIFQSKKDKQRYLDYAYKIGLKKAFESLIREGVIKSDEVKRIYVYNDEHSTDTNKQILSHI